MPTEVLNDLYIKRNIEETSKTANATILVGAFNEENGEELENSVFCVDPSNGFSDLIYSKRRLVPFGEFVPWRKFIMTVVPPLNELTIIGDDLTPGEGAQLIDTEYGKVGAIICFDSIYESLARQSVSEGANILCVSTNDSWFSDSSAVYEHNSHSVLRAVENERYVVRAANTGISSIISPTGEVITSLEPLVRGYVSADVTMIEEKSLYTVIGDVIVWISLAVVGFISLFGLFIDRRKKYGNKDRTV